MLRCNPDEDRDVIVHYIEEVAIGTGKRVRETWTLFVGNQLVQSFTSERDSVVLAQRLGQVYERPVWIFGREGHPLKRIVSDPSGDAA